MEICATTTSVSVLVDNMADNSTTKPARKQRLKEWLENSIRNQVITFIEYNEISKIEPTGEGGYAAIMAGTWRSKLVALKILKTALRFDPDDLATLAKE